MVDEEKKIKRRSERAGVLKFANEMVSALFMAFVFIVYVVQAFRIPTGSMENSLLVGDFLLGLKFIYGAPVLPFVYKKLPAVTDPKPGDVVIFKYPGQDKKDYIKRCVAGPGQTIKVEGTNVWVDGKKLKLPPRGKFVRGGNIDPMVIHFAPLRIPAKGDTLHINTLPIREFLFAKHLIHQENPRKNVSMKLQIYMDGEYANSRPLFKSPYGGKFSFDQVDFNKIDNWTIISSMLKELKSEYPDHNINFSKFIYLDGKPVVDYVVNQDNYFMMGDNRDNSLDSRFWGYLNRNFVKAKAFILYFSIAKYYEDSDNNIKKFAGGKEKEIPWIMLPLKIRWNRIGKLIRSEELFEQ